MFPLLIFSLSLPPFIFPPSPFFFPFSLLSWTCKTLASASGMLVLQPCATIPTSEVWLSCPLCPKTVHWVVSLSLYHCSKKKKLCMYIHVYTCVCVCAYMGMQYVYTLWLGAAIVQLGCVYANTALSPSCCYTHLLFWEFSLLFANGDPVWLFSQVSWKALKVVNTYFFWY